MSSMFFDELEYLRLVAEATPAGTIAQGKRLFGYERNELLACPVQALVPRYQAQGPLFLDINERRRRRNAEEERDRALDASQAKSEFVAVMSHELRAQLNAIIGASEFLEAAPLDERLRFYVQKILESAEGLLSIINGTLEFAQIEAGKVRLNDEFFDLEKVLISAADVSVHDARKKRITINASIDTPLFTPLYGDCGRLRQILVNLITNAVKFTERGSVFVRACAAEITSEETVVRFEVHDTGRGIAQEMIPKLFIPFARLEGSLSSGTGLGLSISKQLVELLGGQMGVFSTPGQGSLFWFTLRFLRQYQEQFQYKLPSLIVLLYSCDDVFAQITGDYLQSWGVEYRRVRDIEELLFSLHAVGNLKRTIAVIDVACATDTLEVHEQLRDHGMMQDPRIIFVGESDGQLTKPLYPSRLFERISAVVCSEAFSPFNRENMEPSHGKKTTVRVLVAEDNRSIHELLVLQFAELGVDIEIAEDGAQVLEAIQRERFTAIFMDCRMPGVDGLEATRRIRESESGAGERVPIIAMTGDAFQEDREECLAAGMDDHLPKPLRLQALRRMIDRWVFMESS